MNNKGQSLILFVLLVPVVLLLLYAVYEVGRMALLRHELDNINEIAVYYGVSKFDDENAIEDIRSLIKKNKRDIDKITINIEDDKLYIVLEDKLDKNVSLFKNAFVVESSYVGYIENEKKIIKKG